MPTTNTNVTQKLDRFLGKCAACVRPIAVERPGVPGDFLRVPCPECGKSVKLERLYGTETTMTCDPRCEGAVGSDCECACGGANHGGAFLLEGEALASAVAKYRKQAQVRSDAAKKVAEERKASREAHARTSRLESLSEEEVWVSQYQGQSSFLVSLRDQVGEYIEGSRPWGLSDRQIAAVRENMTRAMRDQTMGRTPKTERQPCPEGEGVEITGVVIKLTEKEMANGPVLQGRVKTDAGWSAWGTIPRALREADVEVGQRVTFTATMRRKDDTFGFWSYPEGGEVVA